MKMRTMGFAVSMLLAGCATQPPQSFVDPSTPAEITGKTVAAIVRVLAREEAPKDLSLVPSQPGNPLTEELVAALVAAGYTVSETGAPVLYQVTPFQGGTLLRVGVNGRMASTSSTGGPLVVRKE